jgi:spermidine synthase
MTRVDRVGGAIVREYLAIVLQELGLRTAARRLRAPQRGTAPPIQHESLPEPRTNRSEGKVGEVQGEALHSGKPLVIDTESERQLQFSGDALQSRMRLDDPYALVAAYTRQMMSFLLFEPDPEHVLLIGLGGGSLAKFCYRHLPHARITVVEIDAQVIALREAFCIPPDDHRFRVVHEDGARYVSRHEQPVNAILIDAFDHAGVSPSLATPEFFREAARLLAPTGVLVMNLRGDPRRFAGHLEQVRTVFGSRALLAQVTSNDNVLLYAFAADAAAPAAMHLFLRARHLQSKLPLNFRHYLRRLREGWSP